MKSKPKKWTTVPLVTSLTLVLMFVHQTSFSREYIRSEETTPKSVDEIQDAMDLKSPEEEIEELSVRGFLYPALKKHLNRMPSFWRDTRLGFNLRTYEFSRKFVNGSTPEAWAMGGELEYHSGEWNKMLSVSTGLYTSQKIFASGGDGTLLLDRDQSEITVLGKAYLQLRYRDISARFYRQDLRGIPYVNTNDSRMIPFIHEAYIVRRTGPDLDAGFGHVTHLKRRGSDKFISMSEAAGAPGTDKGLSIIGARGSLTKNVVASVVNNYSWDVMNTFYGEMSYTTKLTAQFGIKFTGQFSHQQSVGDELIGSFSTNTAGSKMDMSYKNAILTLGATTTSNNARIRSPYGGRPGFLSLMRFDFDLAGENAFLVGLSYNFAGFGFDEWSFFTNIAHGFDAENAQTNTPFPDRTEYDFTVDYYPKKGLLKGFWIRLRGAILDVKTQNLAHDFRFILNYRINIL